jgi:hypothetical protein
LLDGGLDVLARLGADIVLLFITSETVINETPAWRADIRHRDPARHSNQFLLSVNVTGNANRIV